MYITNLSVSIAKGVLLTTRLFLWLNCDDVNFYVGASGSLKVRLRGHVSESKRHISRFIPFKQKEDGCRSIWRERRTVVALWLEDLHITYGLEYAMMYDMINTLTNIDSGQSKHVTYLKHPEIVKNLFDGNLTNL